MNAHIYKLNSHHDGRDVTRLTLSSELPTDQPNNTQTGEIIGNLTTHLSVHPFGTLHAIDKPGRDVSVVDGVCEIGQGAQSWRYELNDLIRECGAYWQGTRLVLP